MNRIGLIVIIAVVLIAVFNSIYVVNEYDQVIITQFGDPVLPVGAEEGQFTISAPGLHLKIPFIQKVNRFEERFLEWDGDPNELPTRDKRFISVDTYARWHITDPLLYFQRLRDERGAQTRLDDILDGEVRNAIAKYDLLEVVRSSNREAQRTETELEDESVLEPIEAGRGEIRDEVLSTAQARVTDLGIEILDLQFKRINYVEEVQRKVYERMIAERKRIADRFRSEGQGQAARIGGERERELLRIQSGAYKTAEEIKGRADAQATRIYAAAYDRSPQAREFYTFLKTMESYPVAIDASSRLILSTDTDFYRYLKASE